MYASIKRSLKRNEQLNRVTLLLVSPPPPPPMLRQQQQQQQQQQQNTTSMMLKISHKAITKFATVGSNNAGTSAIFKLFQARPALLERRIKRPATAVTAAASFSSDADSSPNVSSRRSSTPGGNHSDINALAAARKSRRQLEK
jgi:hypothetical protein